MNLNDKNCNFETINNGEHSSSNSMDYIDNRENTRIPVKFISIPENFEKNIELINNHSRQMKRLEDENERDEEIEDGEVDDGEMDDDEIEEGNLTAEEPYEGTTQDNIVNIEEMPPSLDSCLHLNRFYQEIITDFIRKLDLLLVENRKRQETLQQELNDAVKKKKQFNGMTRAERTFTAFCQPYFKDKKGFSQPLNEDARQKKEFKEVDAYQRPPIIWTSPEQNKLIAAVKTTAMERKLQSYMNKKEMLNSKLENSQLTASEKKEIDNKLHDLDKEIEGVKKLKDIEIYGPRHTNHDWMKISVIDFEGTRTPLECELYWKMYLHPSIKKGKWTKAENEELKSLVKLHGSDWELISKKMKTSRTPQQCIEHYQCELNDDLLKSKWTPEEDATLFKVIESCRTGDYIPWHQIVYYMEGRSQLQVQRRWNQNLDPAIKKGKWDENEDMLLLAAILKHGQNWVRVKQYLPGRTDVQCRDRWANCLCMSVSFEGWTSEEDKILMKNVNIYGPKWAKIATFLPGRTDAMVAKRYNRIMVATNEVKEENKEALNDNEFVRPKTSTGVKVIRYRNKLYKKFENLLQQIRNESSENTEKSIEKPECLPLNIEKIGNVDLLIRKLHKQMTGKTKEKRSKKFGRPIMRNTSEDIEILEFFRYTQQKRGRPIIKAAPDETDSMYISTTSLFLRAFGSTIKKDYIISEDTSKLPFCPFFPKADTASIPPTCATLFAFKNMLLNRNQLLKTAKNTDETETSNRQKNLYYSPLESAANEFSLVNKNAVRLNFKNLNISHKEHFRMLLARFVALFFWPALLSTQTPTIIEEEPVKKKVKRIEPVRKRKKKKPWVAETMRKRAKISLDDGNTKSIDITKESKEVNKESSDVNEKSSPTEENSLPNASTSKRRGRPFGFKPQKRTPVPLEMCRRSSRLKKSE